MTVPCAKETFPLGNRLANISRMAGVTSTRARSVIQGSQLNHQGVEFQHVSGEVEIGIWPRWEDRTRWTTQEAVHHRINPYQPRALDQRQYKPEA